MLPIVFVLASTSQVQHGRSTGVLPHRIMTARGKTAPGPGRERAYHEALVPLGTGGTHFALPSEQQVGQTHPSHPAALRQGMQMGSDSPEQLSSTTRISGRGRKLKCMLLFVLLHLPTNNNSRG